MREEFRGGAASVASPFSATSYTLASAKDCRTSSVGAGHLKLITGATSSGNSEIAAVFAKNPISLAAIGDYLELTYTFTDTSPIMQSSSAATASLLLGLFNSGGSFPQSGTTLANSGLSSSLTTAATGGTAGWVGYSAEEYNNTWWRLYSRPAQTTVNNNNQALLYNYPNAGSSFSFGNPGSPNLVPGTQYTVQLRVTLSAAGILTVSNALYTGVDTTGPVFTNILWNVSGANLLTTNFDALAIGYRAANSVSWTNDINSIKIVAHLAAQQAGPYFFVTNSGDPCSGGVTISLSGSVTTNTYMLLTNGVYNGVSVTGTGAGISFGAFTVPASYTVLASNTVTTGTGLMYGSAPVYAPGIAINTQPTSVSVVTNLPTSFSVTAIGAALSYQWYKNGVALANGGTISGAQSSTMNISAVQAGDVATSANGYYVKITNPCGDVSYSTTNALTLLAPRNLIWAGANPDNEWDHSELNFLLSGSPAAFAEGDNVTFNDSSANTLLALSNNVTPTLISVTGTQSYTFSGPNKVTGVSQLIDSSSGTLTIINNNDYTGGTIVSNGATLQLGDGATAANNGSLVGTVTVQSGGNVNYSFAGNANTTANLKNTLAGSGTNNCGTLNGSTIATLPSAVCSNFNGTINVNGYTSLHASDNNFGYAFGNGSTVNILQDGGQVWLDRSSTTYNSTFNIQGNGYQGSTPYTGALRIFGSTINGPINLLANSRIGGTINGGTIQSVISGPYQLEVWGTTNSYVLIMGPTNGLPQAYASTLITAGAIRAVNNNGISTGPLTLDSGGDLQLFGNNLSVSNLSSINSGNVTLIEGPRIRNMNTTNTAASVLTVGADGTSTEFDGTFSDGAAGTLGLTKVGNGILTLTLLSSNTGPVTVSGGTIAMSGSGSFNKAPIAIASGAFYDVSSAGGTLTLGSSQSLKGNGTLTGNLSAPSGSLVQPGLPMGTLTVSGSATVNGIYRANLNRTNTGNCSTFTAAGGITFSGANLSVTNVGLGLQAGDSFQLFPGATAGFSTSSLQTNDYVNNLHYTWNNTVATDGKVTVATVTNRVLALQTAPTVSAITYGQAINNSVISGGSVTNANGLVVPGTYAFGTPGTLPLVGTTNQSVTFTPTDASTYNTLTLTVAVTVNKQTPVLKTTPTASTITNGNALSLSILDSWNVIVDRD